MTIAQPSAYMRLPDTDRGLTNHGKAEGNVPASVKVTHHHGVRSVQERLLLW
ncbi:hypothetical protein [Corynebacterium sp. 153RC1]|uniref:hypothetical protein n=1 Tax=Corynebacterium sp. 153RC1 TaxID=2968466 RepID=UPI00211C4DC8|nr:hypothetical protein [Corynebacterium sp. 153RC1]